MKEYETKTETLTRSYLVNLVCDLCGKKSKYANVWNSSDFTVDETNIEITIEQREGKSYPEAGWGTKYEIDLCPQCFKEKLIPWLESQGANIKQEEWGW